MSLVVGRPGKYLTIGGFWLVIGLSVLASPISGCASMSEDHRFAKEMHAEQLTAWEKACHRGGGVVWSRNGRDRTKKCISQGATQETLARMTTPSPVTGAYPRPFD